jgi:outer membrane protein TolC
MDAELALTQANTNYSQALYDYNTSQAQLDKAMGVRVEASGN